jgi:hypothetical protein
VWILCTSLLSLLEVCSSHRFDIVRSLCSDLGILTVGVYWVQNIDMLIIIAMLSVSSNLRIDSNNCDSSYTLLVGDWSV